MVNISRIRSSHSHWRKACPGPPIGVLPDGPARWNLRRPNIREKAFVLLFYDSYIANFSYPPRRIPYPGCNCARANSFRESIEKVKADLRFGEWAKFNPLETSRRNRSRKLKTSIELEPRPERVGTVLTFRSTRFKIHEVCLDMTRTCSRRPVSDNRRSDKRFLMARRESV